MSVVCCDGEEFGESVDVSLSGSGSIEYASGDRYFSGNLILLFGGNLRCSQIPWANTIRNAAWKRHNDLGRRHVLERSVPERGRRR